MPSKSKVEMVPDFLFGLDCNRLGNHKGSLWTTMGHNVPGFCNESNTFYLHLIYVASLVLQHFHSNQAYSKLIEILLPRHLRLSIHA